MQEVREKFLEWARDTSELKEVEAFSFIGSKVLIRLFYFQPEKKGSLILTDDAAQSIIGVQPKVKSEKVSMGSKILPFAKVLAVGENVTGDFENLVPGDIVAVSDEIHGVHLNPQWLDWAENGGNNGRGTGSVKSPEPSKFIGNIAKFREYVFKSNKFVDEIEPKDAFTFLMPQSLILSKVDVSKI